MSFLRSLFLPSAAHDSDGAAFDIVPGSAFARRTSSGEYVSPAKAMTLSVWFACVRAIAEDVGKLPLIVYRRVGPNKERASNTPLYRLLHDAPNPEQNAGAFRETINGWAESWGNGYAEIQRASDGTPIALWPIHPSRARVCRFEGSLYLDVYGEGSTPSVRLPYRDVIHIRGFGDDPLCGLSVAGLAAESLGVSLAAQQYGASFFGNGANPSVVLTHPGKLSEVAQANLRESWKKRHSGSKNANGVAVLQEGIKLEKLTIPPEEAQFLETRQFQIPEIARWFRMPPHKVQDLSRSTFSNIEHQATEYLSDTLMPWLVRWEQELSRKLMDDRQREEFAIEHLVDAILRGDLTARSNYYRTMIQIGALSPDEARARENLNPIPGGAGARYYVQGAMVPLESAGQQQEKAKATEPEEPASAETKPANSTGWDIRYDETGAMVAIDERAP